MPIIPTPVQPIVVERASPRLARRGAAMAAGYVTFAERFPAFIGDLQPLRQRRREMLRRLGIARGRHQRSLVRQALASRELHLFYAYEGVRRAGQLATATPETIAALADQCDPFAAAAGGVIRREIVKRGQTRLVDVYSPLKRMRQVLVADVLRAIHPPRLEQYLFHGGMPKALGAIEAAYQSGWHWAVQVDVIGFYRSVPFDGLAELLRPLPASVIEHVVWDGPARGAASPSASMRSVSSRPSLNGSSGLSLGSATSPIVGEIIIGHVLARLPFGAELVTYADNILVFGRERNEALARAQDLERAFADHSAMPLRLRTGDVASFEPRHLISDTSLIGVEFAHQVASEQDGRLSWGPTVDRWLDYQAEDITASMTLEEVERMEHRVARWRRAYGTWDEGAAWETEMLAQLAGVRYFLDAQPLHLAAAINAVVAAIVASGYVRSADELVPDAGDNAQHARRRSNIIHAVNQLLGSIAA